MQCNGKQTLRKQRRKEASHRVSFRQAYIYQVAILPLGPTRRHDAAVEWTTKPANQVQGPRRVAKTPDSKGGLGKVAKTPVSRLGSVNLMYCCSADKFTVRRVAGTGACEPIVPGAPAARTDAHKRPFSLLDWTCIPGAWEPKDWTDSRGWRDTSHVLQMWDKV